MRVLPIQSREEWRANSRRLRPGCLGSSSWPGKGSAVSRRALLELRGHSGAGLFRAAKQGPRGCWRGGFASSPVKPLAGIRRSQPGADSRSGREVFLLPTRVILGFQHIPNVGLGPGTAQALVQHGAVSEEHGKSSTRGTGPCLRGPHRSSASAFARSFGARTGLRQLAVRLRPARRCLAISASNPVGPS